MANLNRVLMIGGLTGDPELRYMPNGMPKTTLRLAVSREWKDKTTGEPKTDVCYIDVIVWNRQAEVCKQYLRKGRQVFVEGRLDFDEWDINGEKRSKHFITADRVQFLDRRPQEAEAGQQRTLF